MLTVKDLNSLHRKYYAKNITRKKYDIYNINNKCLEENDALKNIIFPIEYNGEKYYIISKLKLGYHHDISIDIKGYNKFIFFDCTFDIDKFIYPGSDICHYNEYKLNVGANEVYIYNCNIFHVDIDTDYLNISKCNIFCDHDSDMIRLNKYIIDVSRVNHFNEDNNYLKILKSIPSSYPIANTTIEKTPNKYCPPIGQSFIGYKKVILRNKISYVYNSIAIVELEVPTDAIRYDAMFLNKDQYKKIRVNKAIVKDIIVNTMANIYPIEELEFVSSYDHNFKYYIGQEISLEDNSFDYNRNVICGKGIHLFMTIDEALNYVI